VRLAATGEPAAKGLNTVVVALSSCSNDLMYGVGNVCFGLGSDSRCDPRSMVGLLVAGYQG
jgi:hypothetical protein